MIRFASLGSGSAGNAWVVECGSTRLLLDCGFSMRETTRRLARLGLKVADLHGILITHEHGDHIGGAFKLSLRHGLPVWLTHGTLAASNAGADMMPLLRIIDSHSAFVCGDLEIQPYPLPHDAREPVHYVFGDGVRRLGALTDAGHVTPHMVSVLNGCDALVLEANHDRDMLARGRYPPALKRRVGGRFGHLENREAADLLSRLDCRRLQHLVAAHLSQHNNTRALACQAFAAVLGCAEDWIGVADQAEGCGWREVV